jgi:hypothetical protein
MTGKRRSAPAAEFSCNAAAIAMAGAPCCYRTEEVVNSVREPTGSDADSFWDWDQSALAGFAATPTLADGKRVALVIGNSAYATQQDRHQSSL